MTLPTSSPPMSNPGSIISRLNQVVNVGNITSRWSPVRLSVTATLICGVLAVAYLFTHRKMPLGIAVGILPAVLCMLWVTLRKPAVSMLGMFIVNYFIMWLGRYTRDIPIGTILDAALYFNVLMVAVQAMVHRLEWGRIRSGLLVAALIWTIYCTIELFNPLAVPAAWFTTIRSFAVYFLLIALLTPLTMGEFKWLRYMLIIWAVLTLIAVSKALIQKFVGFNEVEKYWLYVLGARRTHIIYSGIRYFSFFSDAANFGASMGMSMVVFSIAALHFRNGWMKFFLLFVAAAACYGMLISGTRSALAVPFAGYAAFIVLSRNIRMAIAGLMVLIGAFIFLNFTNIGQGNQIIRRARSAFNTDDASFNVRLDNQAKLRVLMADKPFGAGLGMGGGKAKNHAPDAPLSQIPTDSWFVLIWVETGVVGLLLHISILIYVLAWGSFQVLFRLRSPQVRGLTVALICGLSGIIMMSYANEVLGQIPNGAIVYMCMAFIFLAPRFDREMTGTPETPKPRPA